MTKKNILLSLLMLISGSLLIVAFAPYRLYPLAAIMPAVLLWAILNQTAKKAAYLGFVFGLGFFLAGTNWIFISIHQFGETPAVLAMGIVLLLASILAIFPALACYLTNRLCQTTTAAKLMLAFPACWVLFEWMRSLVGDGFPWLFLGYSYTQTPLDGFAPLMSVYAVSLASAMTSGALLYAWIAWQQKDRFKFFIGLTVIVTLWASGALLSCVQWTKASDDSPLTVSLVQGNIPQSLKWSPEHTQLSIDRYTTLSASLWGQSELIVWPEAAIPLSLQEAADFIDDMDQTAKAHHTTLVLGVPVEDTMRDNNYYNAMIALGEKKAIYLKRRLVPFGEYLPLSAIFSHFFNLIHLPLPNMQAGQLTQKTFTINHLTIDPSICFELAFPELIRMRDKKMGFLLSLTNDAWFGNSIAQSLHLQIAEMRALELGRPVLLASNDGLTAIIGPHGEWQAIAAPHTATVLKGTVQPMIGYTPWAHFGMDPLLIILFSFLWIARKNNAAQYQEEKNKNGTVLSPSNA